MRLRRKGQSEPQHEAPAAEDDAEPAQPATGPFDFDSLGIDPDDELEVLDLGGLLIPPPPPGHDIQVQVDEGSGEIMAVLVAGNEGALELRAFAASRNASLWDEVRQGIAADATQMGGTASAQDGAWGPELLCMVPVTTEDGRSATQPSRVIGVDGPRWFLRAMILGRPAVEAEVAGPLEDLLRAVVVRRGAEAMPHGEQLPLHLPKNAEPAE